MKYLSIPAVAAAALLLSAARADEKDDALARQKAAAATLWKKMEFKEAAAPIETAHLLVYARLPEAKVRPLAANLDKLFAAALKPLKYSGKDPPWPGKLAVFLLPERSEFVEFMRKSGNRSPGEDDASLGNVSGDIAMVIVGAPRSGQAETEELARSEVAALLLRRKLGGADPPDWLVAGFERATTSRLARPMNKAASAPPVAFKELWSDNLDSRGKAKVATYLVDYLAYGPAADLFADFVGALRPGDGGAMPSWKEAYDAIKMDEVALEAYARAWKKPPAPRSPATRPKKP